MRGFVLGSLRGRIRRTEEGNTDLSDALGVRRTAVSKPRRHLACTSRQSASVSRSGPQPPRGCRSVSPSHPRLPRLCCRRGCPSSDRCHRSPVAPGEPERLRTTGVRERSLVHYLERRDRRMTGGLSARVRVPVRGLDVSPPAAACLQHQRGAADRRESQQDAERRRPERALHRHPHQIQSRTSACSARRCRS